MCGSDPIAVLEGGEHLSPVGGEEAKTLKRLGLPAHARLACSARLTGSGAVFVSTNPEEPARDGNGDGTVEVVVSVSSVVIIGNGVAGVTAAEEVRRAHPTCDIHLIGREAFPFYNRMAISRLVYDRSAMSGLTMRDDHWYEAQNITCWLNTQVRSINRGRRTVVLATGEVLNWDRLILATGSRSSVPPFPGAKLPGVFVLREATDAMALRAFVQEHGSTNAVVVGGGLLGLEAAHALHQLGLATSVLEGAPRLLPRFLDEAGSTVLGDHFAREGVDVRCGVKVEAIVGQDRVEGVHLGAEGHLRADVVVICAGITPNVDLAREAGIAVNRGVLVDASMRTSAAGVYAIGDAAEFDGMVVGLWATASSQAEVAGAQRAGPRRDVPPHAPCSSAERGRRGAHVDRPHRGERRRRRVDEHLAHRRPVLQGGHRARWHLGRCDPDRACRSGTPRGRGDAGRPRPRRSGRRVGAGVIRMVAAPAARIERRRPAATGDDVLTPTRPASICSSICSSIELDQHSGRRPLCWST